MALLPVLNYVCLQQSDKDVCAITIELCVLTADKDICVITIELWVFTAVRQRNQCLCY